MQSQCLLYDGATCPVSYCSSQQQSERLADLIVQADQPREIAAGMGASRYEGQPSKNTAAIAAAAAAKQVHFKCQM